MPAIMRSVTLFEDDALFILHKPANAHSVAHSEGEGEPSVAADLLAASPQLREVADRPGDAGLVNRLDFGTSGILIGAKSRAVWEALRGDIQSGEIKKRYLAVLEGIAPLSRTIENFIGSPYRRAQKVRVYDDLPRDGRALPAISIFRLREPHAAQNISLVEVEAPTARRHQIRVHARSIGHPLVGDTLYGATRSLGDIFTEQANGFCLHAYSVELTHPLHRRTLSIVDPAPEYLSAVFSEKALRVG